MLDPSGFTLMYDRALCRGLLGIGADVTLYTRPPRPGEARPEPFHMPHFHRGAESSVGRRLPERVRLAMKGVEYGVDAARLLAALAADRPDVVHVQWMPVPLMDRAFIGALKTIAPVVATVHDTTPFRGSPSARVQEIGWQAALQAADRLIVHTEFSRQVLEGRGVPGDRIVRIDHGQLDPGRYVPSPRTGPLRVLLFGALKTYKGVAVVAEAVRLLVADGVDVQLRVVGSPRMELDLAPGVDWDLRWVPDAEVPAVLAEADVHVFPYREIDASGALRTVLGRGAPVVASNVGGPGELLTHDVDALLVPPEDPEALARAIRALDSAELRERLARGGEATAASLPPWTTIAEQTVAAYVTR